MGAESNWSKLEDVSGSERCGDRLAEGLTDKSGCRGMMTIVSLHKEPRSIEPSARTDLKAQKPHLLLHGHRG